MTFVVETASLENIKLKIALFGQSGSGKTYSALRMAYGITGDWSKIGVIDTENRSARLYVDRLGPFKTIDFQAPYSPERYIEAIKAIQASGVEVIIIDSISHEWAGPGGVLELVDDHDGKSKYHNGWRDLTPRHNAFIHAISHNNQCHIICCGRSKQDYLTIEDCGKKEIAKAGLNPIFRDGFEYEQTVVFNFGLNPKATDNHKAKIDKDRTGLFGRDLILIDETVGNQLIQWANSGGAQTVAQEDMSVIQSPAKNKPGSIDVHTDEMSDEAAQKEQLRALKSQINRYITDQIITKEEYPKITGYHTIKDLTLDQALDAKQKILASVEKGK